MVGRRAIFFAVTGAICLALYYPTPPEFRWVCLFFTGLAWFWAVMSALDDVSTHRSTRHRRVAPVAPGTPFDPPSRPGSSGR